jgi:hypothetical protein
MKLKIVFAPCSLLFVLKKMFFILEKIVFVPCSLLFVLKKNEIF